PAAPRRAPRPARARAPRQAPPRATRSLGMSNGRTIRKRLMRSRCTVFWGARAYCTVRLPLSLFPPVPPGPAAPEGEGWIPSEISDFGWTRKPERDDGVLHEIV